MYVESDRSKGCTNYPTAQFSSYNECDEDYMREVLKKHYPPTFRPVWLYGTSATKLMTFPNNTDTTDSDLFKGSLLPPRDICPLPCLTSHITTDHLYDMKAKNISTIDIIFSSSVEVTTSSYPTFSPSQALASLGGSLGLWLGLGAAQAVEMVLKLIFTRALN